MARPSWRWSIERKLPLVISGLLALVIGGFSWAAYDQVRREALAAADARLDHVSRQLEALLEGNVRTIRGQIAAAAARPALRAYLRSPGAGTRVGAVAALRDVASVGQMTAAAELWDSTGRPLLQSAALPEMDPAVVATLLAAVGGPDSTAVGPLHVVNDSLLFPVVAAIADRGRTLGYAVQRRRVASSPETAQQLAALIGSEAALLMGNARGDLWTDFAVRTAAPPVDVREHAGLLEYERPERGRLLARSAPIAGTPWAVLVEFPREPVLAGARRFLRRVLLIAIALVVAGGAGAWALSRRITGPLALVTDAAEAIAGGDLAPRAHVSGTDELGRLARSFNAMAEQIGRSQHRLEAEVAERTHALRESETRLRGVTETAHDAIIAANTAGDIAYWNPGAARMFGYATDEVLGRALTMLMPARYHDAHRQGIRRYVETAEPRVVGRTVELEGRRKNGSEFPIELSLAAARTEGGIAFTGIIRDITERKRIEEALRQTNAELEAFSYSVSHDLRAPLRAIHGFARMLVEDHGAQLAEEPRRLLTVIDDNTRRMGQLIDDLLAFSRLGRKELETSRVNMTELVRSIADDLRRAEGDRLLDIEIDPLPPARGDRDLLRQVVTNLLQNAVKFTRGRSPTRIHVGHRADGEGAVYYVKDNGAGFDQRYADKLFGVFQRQHRAEEFEGTGVGLAIAQRIVHRHGGRVWAEGVVNEGATFYFSLPGASDA